MVETKFLSDEQRLPVVVEAQDGDAIGVDALIGWWREHREWLEGQLHEHGAVLMRGFAVDGRGEFERFARAATGELLDYVDGNSPRTKVGGGVYTSTEYPPEYFISMHNELSYADRWPSRIFFYCDVEPEEGGETPLIDSRRLLAALDDQLVEEFRRRQVRYIRNLHAGKGFGPSWQKTFETEDRDQAEEYAKSSGMELEWLADGGLRLSSVRPATIEHRKTGEEVWFNQADQFHPSTHPKEIYESMKVLYRGREDRMPQNATFGDGTPIDPERLDEIRRVTRDHLITFPWRRGDVLAVDNELVAHGRMPFSGRRRILVSMSDH